MNDLREAGRQAAEEAGITWRDVPQDGRWHETPAEGKGSRNGAGRVKLHPDGEGGLVWNWITGECVTFWARSETSLNSAEREARRKRAEELRRQTEEERQQAAEECRQQAAKLWKEAKPAPPDHPYLVRKGIKAHRARVSNDRLVVPVWGPDGTLHGLQFIDSEGNKRFLTGTAKAGHYASLGGKPEKLLYLAEGFATGATIQEATGGVVAVAFDCDNLRPVAEALAAKYPEARLVICADNDSGTEGNPGRTKGTAAAQAVGGLLAVPDFPEGAEGTDFNDLAAAAGLDVVRRQIEAAQPVKRDNEGGEKTTPGAILQRASDVAIKAVQWLWLYWIARGKLHVLAGQAGTGKTNLLLALLAIITRGGRWPDGAPGPEPAHVLIWSAEDAADDTLVPRLISAGADLDRVHIIAGVTNGGKPRPFDPSTDLDELLPHLRELRPAALMVDPIVSAVSGDSHKNAETRRSLQPLVDLAEQFNVAVIGISHFTKGTTNREPLERVTGSLAFGALARVVLAAAKLPPDNPHGCERILARAKSNVGPDSGGIGYRLTVTEVAPGVEVAGVEWQAVIDGTARELLAEPEHEEGGALGEARAFLLDFLGDSPQPAKEVLKAARQAGVSDATLRRAKTAAGVVAIKSGLASGWLWSLGRCSSGPEDAQQNNTSAFEDAQGFELGTFDRSLHTFGG